MLQNFSAAPGNLLQVIGAALMPLYIIFDAFRWKWIPRNGISLAFLLFLTGCICPHLSEGTKEYSHALRIATEPSHDHLRRSVELLSKALKECKLDDFNKIKIYSMILRAYLELEDYDQYEQNLTESKKIFHKLYYKKKELSGEKIGLLIMESDYKKDIAEEQTKYLDQQTPGFKNMKIEIATIHVKEAQELLSKAEEIAQSLQLLAFIDLKRIDLFLHQSTFITLRSNQQTEDIQRSLSLLSVARSICEKYKDLQLILKTEFQARLTRINNLIIDREKRIESFKH